MRTFRIYSDESRHKNERFLLLGGLWVEEEYVSELLEEMRSLRREHGYVDSAGRNVDFLGELKWTKVSDKYFEVYRKVVDLFFQWMEEGKVRFCAMLVDTHDPIVPEYENLKREGYLKLLYQLYLHNSKVPAVYKIFPDRITNPTQHKVNFTRLQSSLETSLRKKLAPLMKHVLNKLTLAGSLKVITKKYMVVKSTRFNIWVFRPKRRE